MLGKSRSAGVLLCTLSTAFPVVLAGAREYTVGTDIATYGNYVFQAAVNARRLPAFLRSRRDIDLLYKALAFVVSRFTNNAHWFYFVTALIICGLIMCGLFYYGRWCSVTLGWTCFLFLFYGDTLNVMRQSLALAVVFAVFPLFIEKRYFLYGVGSIIGILFHTTGIIALLFPVIYLFMKKIPPRWLQFFVVIAFMVVILFYSPLLRTVLQMNLLPAKFSRYLAKGLAFALNPTILRLPFLVPILLYYDRFCGFERLPGIDVNAGLPENREEREKTQTLGMFVVAALLMEICTVQLRSVTPALYRISYYFGFFRFIAYPRLVGILRRDNRIIAAAVLIAYLTVLWYYQNVIQGNNQIMPYIYSPEWFAPHVYLLPAE